MKKSSSSSHLILLATGDFNWKLSDEINPFKISVSEQTREFHRFLNNFTKAKSFAPATPDQYWHLIRNLQCSIKSYDKYVISLQSEITELHKTIKKLKIFHKKKLDEIYKKNVEKYLCPICLEPQSTLVDLDFHISQKHNDSYDKWNNLRCEGIKKYMSKDTNKEDENENPNSINELHDWMNDKFNYLERLIYEKRKERKNEYHRHHHTSDYNQSPNIPNKIENNKFDSTGSESDSYHFHKNKKPTFNFIESNSFHKNDKPISNISESSIGVHPINKNDGSSFNLNGNNLDIGSSHKNSKPTFNLTGNSNLTSPFYSPNRKIIHSNEDINQNDESSQESSMILSNIESKKGDNQGHFVEEIENNKNHSIFISTNSLSRLKSKSEDN